MLKIDPKESENKGKRAGNAGRPEMSRLEPSRPKKEPWRASALQFWPGPFVSEAKAAFARARDRGVSLKRSLVLGAYASYKDGWLFRKTMAVFYGISVKTVGRALTQGVELGLIGRARSKPGEIPPGMDHPVDCGFSHRWTIGWGKVGEAIGAAVAAAKDRWQTRKALKMLGANLGKGLQPVAKAEPASEPKPARPSRPRAGGLVTPEQYDAQLADLARRFGVPAPA